jgi:hypothetical protein
MSVNPEVDGIVSLPLAQEPAEVTNGHPADAAVAVAVPVPEAQVVEVQGPAAPRRQRPAWIVPAAIAVIGVIASGTLGYFLYATVQQRDGLHQKLVSTSATLAQTQSDLSAAQADAASKKVTATYVAMYLTDEGKAETDYQTIVNCSDYSTCRTAAQQMLMDLQAFQADRKAANVPSSLASTDSSLGDALSAAIAGDQEFITGMDNDDVSKIKEGGKKIDAAMLSLAKAQATLGGQLK